MKHISAKNACTSIEQCYQTCSALDALLYMLQFILLWVTPLVGRPNRQQLLQHNYNSVLGLINFVLKFSSAYLCLWNVCLFISPLFAM